MTIYRLGRVPLDRIDHRSGRHLTLDRLDPRLLALLVNSGTSILLRSIDYLDSGTRLYPSQSNLNASRASSNRKLSIEFFLDNDLEETNPTVLYDDDETFWSANCWGSGTKAWTVLEDTSNKIKGTSCVGMLEGAGGNNAARLYHAWGSNQDWSAYDFLCLYVFGVNSGHTMALELEAPDGANRIRPTWIDNWSGWKRLVLPLRYPWPSNIGSPNLAQIRYMDLVDLTVYFFDAAVRFDRLVLDVGQWVKTELHIPDVLVKGTNLANAKVLIYHWDGSQYRCCTEGGQGDPEFRYIQEVDGGGGYALKFLDGSKVGEIYGSVSRYDQKGTSVFFDGRRGETKNSVWAGGQGVTYSSEYGTLKRWGFALKMPPDNGQDSSTAGISQTRLKLEVYYV